MKAPISWLQDFVKIDIPAEALADKLVHAGFEVEEIIREADAIKNVVTGRVLAMERHPNSDHLWICQINVKTATLQIVTGAQNVQVVHCSDEFVSIIVTFFTHKKHSPVLFL